MLECAVFNLVAFVLATYIAIPFSLPLLEITIFQYQIARFEAYVNPWVAGDSGHN